MRIFTEMKISRSRETERSRDITTEQMKQFTATTHATRDLLSFVISALRLTRQFLPIVYQAEIVLSPLANLIVTSFNDDLTSRCKNLEEHALVESLADTSKSFANLSQ